MNASLKTIKDLLQQNNNLSEAEKEALLKTIADADKQWSITDFKLDRTEKVKKTTAILLEETIEELEHKRKAVEAQNRELEIESSLEKVRTVAMGMRNRDDMLDICRMMSAQLELLGIKEIRNVQTAIFYKEKGTYVNYEYYRLYDKTFITEVDYTLDEISTEFAAQMTKGANEVFIRSLKGEQLKDWFNFQKTTNVFIDTHLEKATSLTYHWFSLGLVALGTSTYEPLNEAEIKLFERFRNVFGLAYQRYIDIEQAEAQAREAQIQLALERVRARTMAMQASNELPDAANLLFQQIQSLGMSAWSAGYCIWDEDKKGITLWMSSEGVIQPPFRAPLTEDPSFIHMREAHERGETFFVFEIGGEEIVEHYKYMRTLPVVGEILDSITEAGHPLPTFQIFHLAFFSQGFLLFITYEPVPGAHDIFKRFGKVFEQTYTRFLDLQKAEAQARESQIQLTMERVRARTMAMQHSSELADAAMLLFRQMQQLNIPAWSTGYCIWEDNKQAANFWMSSEGLLPSPFKMPLTEEPVFMRYREAYLQGEEFYAAEYSGEKLASMYAYMMEFPAVRNMWNRFSDEGTAPAFPTFQINHVVYFAQGFLLFVTHEHVPEAHDIFKRFGKVFEQTYTRFLDLQKAEEQARESQIQLALERVRARAMAMQKSGELSELVDTVFKELTKLDFALNWCIINIIDESSLSNTVWAANPDIDKAPESYHMKFEDYPFHDAMMKGYKERATKYIYVLEGAEKKIYDEYLFNETEFRRVPAEAKAASRAMEKYVVSFSFSNFGGLQTVGNESLSDANLDILERFGKVFDLTYTRFNDLLKAEAQAKEAQIEAALERVRSRSMGMQKSNELKEVIQVVYEQFVHLNIHVEHTGFIMDYKARDDMHIWLADKHAVPFQVTIPFFDCAHWNSFNEAKEKGLNFFANHLSFEEKNKFYQDLFKLIPGVPVETLEYYFSCPGLAISTVLLENVGLYIENFSGIPYTDEENNTLMRFGKVFQQTYTRFNDLQKAETRAREAKIEAALEKVRSRSLAMHKSDELNEVVTILFEKIKELQIPVTAVGIGIYIDGSKDLNTYVCGENEDRLVINNYRLPYFHHEIWNDLNNAREKKLDFFSGNYSKEEKNSFYKYVLEHSALRHLPDDIKSLIFESPAYTISMTPVKHSMFMINDFEGKILSENEVDIIKRFARVFDQAYTRFLDLQKAEAQAREAKIEAALERTRTQSMIMQHSKELDDVLRVFHEQVLLLGIHSAFSFLWLPDEKDDRHIFWAAWKEDLQDGEAGKNASGVFKSKAINYPLDRNEPATAQCLVDWKGDEPIVSYHVPPSGVANYFAAWQELIDGVEQLKPEYFSGGLYYVEAFMKYGCFGVIVATDLNEDEKKILGRFAIEFERTYTRFLDLQKAEAQARESQIEAALEKVRSRTMAMQKSSDLADTSALLFKQLNALVPELWTCGFVLCDKNKTVDEWWLSGGNGFMPDLYLPNVGDALHNNIYQAWLNGQSYYEEVIEGYALEQHYEWLMKIPSAKAAFEAQAAAGIKQPVWQQLSCANFSRGYLVVITEKICGEAQIFKRFSQVFDQTYTRFLDLQKSEAQARESQIQLAMERVRARTMAMQKSDELREAASLLFKQLEDLGIKSWSSGFNIWQGDRRSATINMCNPDGSIATAYHLPHTENIFFMRICEARERGDDLLVMETGGKELEETYNYMFSLPEVKMMLGGMEDTGFQIPKFQVSHCAFFSQGYLMFITYEPVPEIWDVFKRFAKVFEQTYTRFLDLQRAEAQARESKIEAALERVRARAMAMQNSDELSGLVAILFEELIKLDLVLARCIIWIFDNDTLAARVWMANSEDKKTVDSYFIKQLDHPYYKTIIREWKERNPKWVYVLEGNFKKSIDELLLNETELSRLPEAVKKGILDSEHTIISGSFNNFGLIEASGPVPHSEEQLEILNRFGKVFDLTYTRFNDLKQAEAQAREAIKSSSLDRVRAEIASMRATSDLERITPLIWNELTTLGVPFTRCGVFIMDEEEQKVQTLLSTPDGKAIATLHVPFEFDLSIITNGVSHWRKKEIYKEHWDALAFAKAWTALSSLRDTSTTSPQSEHPPENLYLHLLPFLQGMLYVGNDAPLNETELQLVQNLADAFATAYARYEDFNKLESANIKIEKTLVDLKQAQTQLVQSEKMASLGELTAGIAHEIQNPLNFVNNFSDVSSELLEEMKTELKKGNTDEAMFIVEDVKQNLEKILHHGKRADAIVKGMLQHSRSSTGVKEPTDINVLADEYLRLAYHGLRAKDKSFNAKFETYFDKQVGKINIIPQDIGRVLVNLISNAFYAVGVKSKSPLTPKGGKGNPQDKEYEPTVTVSTALIPPLGARGPSVQIKVSDNGGGIPQKVVDKIFQPFFTTKPTGQGTGLGLSLSYDIIKAHGGEIKVETKEGQGSEFIVILPLS